MTERRVFFTSFLTFFLSAYQSSKATRNYKIMIHKTILGLYALHNFRNFFWFFLKDLFILHQLLELECCAKAFQWLGYNQTCKVLPRLLSVFKFLTSSFFTKHLESLIYLAGFSHFKFIMVLFKQGFRHLPSLPRFFHHAYHFYFQGASRKLSSCFL